MQTGVLGHGQETRDKELCGVGVELLPAGVHSGVHPVPNHCWSPPLSSWPSWLRLHCSGLQAIGQSG